MDPQSDGPIHDAEKADDGNDDPWAEERDEEDELLKPSRWWFASTACPLIAGTFGPMANAFNICALVQFWREYIPVGSMEGHGELKKDPAWLTGLNAVSLALAVVANTALMLNMVGRARFAIAQSLTIAGFFTSSVLLIGLVIAANTEDFRLNVDAPGSQRALTQGYYFACFASVMYFMIASLMVLTVYGAMKGKYKQRFDISTPQRTLMMQTISLMAYLLLGAAIYVGFEGWAYNDAVYWSTFTLLTIGIGEPLVPITHGGRSFLFFYTFGGIISIGLVISSIRALLLEKGAAKLHARTVEKKRQNIQSIQDAGWGHGHWWSFLLPKVRHPKPPNYRNEREKREAEFMAMRTVQERTASKNRYRALAISSSNAAVLWFIGALVFYYSEKHLQHWTYFDSIYFSWTSLITLGYGDFQPLSNAGKAFFVLWALLAIPTLTVLISDLSDTVVAWVNEVTNWIGSLTIAPGKTTFYDNMRKGINKFSGGRIFESWTRTMQQDQIADEERNGRRGNLQELLERRFKDTEKAAMDQYAQEADEGVHQRDIHFYHYVLVREIQQVLADSNVSPPKQYTYDEWAYYLWLLGQNENDSTYHRNGFNTPKKDDEDAPQVGRIVDHEGCYREWSWLSLRSPMMAPGSEADWILKHLLNKLHRQLQFQGKPRRGIGHQDHPPPFSISALRGHSTGFQANRHSDGVNGMKLKQTEAP